MGDYKRPPQFLWKNMPRKDVPACQVYEDFLDSAQRRDVFESDSKTTLQQITEAQAHYFDAWVWNGCRDSKRLAEFYEQLETAVIHNQEVWRRLVEGIAKGRVRKANHLLVDKETLRAFEQMNIKEAEREINELREEGFNKESSVNTKSISGDTDDDAASLTSEPIHKRLDHSDK